MERDGLAGLDDPAQLGGQAVFGQAAATPRYCPRCGAVWDALLGSCQPCAERNAHHAAAALAPVCSIGSAIALYFIFLSIVLVASVVAALSQDDAQRAVLAVFGSDVLTSMLVLLWVGCSWKCVAPALRNPAWAWWPLAAGSAVVTFALAWLMVAFLVYGLEAEDLNFAALLAQAGYGFGTLVLVLCVQPAVIEELAFRGIMFQSFEHTMGARNAILVSAAIFAIAHCSIVSLPHLLIIGLVLGWLRHRSRSLYPGMVLHFVHNLQVAVVDHYQAQSA